MDIKISKAKEVDALKMNELLTKLIQDERQYDKNIDENFVVESFYEHYVEDNSKCLLVAKVDDAIIGYIYGYIKTLEGGEKPHKEAKLDAIYVEVEYRKKHVAEELIKKFKVWAKENEVTSLEVDVCANNIKAYNLYLKNGFIEIKKTLKVDI